MDQLAYLALRESAAFVVLAGRGHIQATGEDRARLLHAMTSNHVEALQPGDCQYTLFLNAQGRILSDANILCTESSLVVDTEPEAATTIFEHLDRYIIADDVTLTNLTRQVGAISLEGPQAPAVLERMGIDIPAPGHWSPWRTYIVAALAGSFRFFVPEVELESSAQWIEGAGAQRAGTDEWDVVRLEHGVPRYSLDITDREIPHETGLVERAISFTKGCYLGQEIVERVRSRGHANRRLARFRIAGTTPPGARTKLRDADGTELGEITSAAYSPAEDAVLALGYARTQTLKPGATFVIEGSAPAEWIP